MSISQRLCTAFLARGVCGEMGRGLVEITGAFLEILAIKKILLLRAHDYLNP